MQPPWSSASMAVEIPSSLIRQIQGALRREAGMPEFDPADPALPCLPSFEEAVSELDPSAPPYLRCEECRAPLVRGLLSTACIYCGAEQRRDPPLSMSFCATLGCRKFLQSLGLDGSEAIELNTEPKDSKGRGTEKNGLVLSSLLNIEIMWPSAEEKMQIGTTNKAPTQTTLNLSGVDLDDFFYETNKEVVSSAHDVSEKMVMPDKEIMDSEEFGLFEELRHIDKTVNSMETKSSDIHDSSGLWEAEFQSGTSHVSATDSNSNDFFQHSFSSNYAHATVEHLSIESEMNREGKSTAFSSSSSQIPSMNNDWPLDDQWHIADSVPSADELISDKTDAAGGRLKPNSGVHDWVQTDLWPTGSTTGLSANENTQSNDDSFDEWQDFTSLGNAPDVLSNSWTQLSTAVTLPNEREPGISSVDFTDRIEDVDFSTFVQSDMLPGLSDFRTDSHKLEMLDLQASFSCRMNEGEKTAMNGDIWTMADKDETLSCTKSPGLLNVDVQDLLSQMHDLSFMLNSDLSIPKKVERSD